MALLHRGLRQPGPPSAAAPPSRRCRPQSCGPECLIGVEAFQPLSEDQRGAGAVPPFRGYGPEDDHTTSVHSPLATLSHRAAPRGKGGSECCLYPTQSRAPVLSLEEGQIWGGTQQSRSVPMGRKAKPGLTPS